MGYDSISVEIYLINCCYAEITKATEQKDNYQVNLVSICKMSDSNVLFVPKFFAIKRYRRAPHVV